MPKLTLVLSLNINAQTIMFDLCTTFKINSMCLSAAASDSPEVPFRWQRRFGEGIYVALCLFGLLFSTTLWAADSFKLEYYEVRGENMQDLRKEMDERGPIGDNGTRNDVYTNWRVHWSYGLAWEGILCRVTSLKTRLEGTTRLPKWIQSDHVSDELVREWDLYTAALRRNADRHHGTGYAAAKEIERRLSNLTGTSGCKKLEETFFAKADSIIREFAVKGNEATTELKLGPTICIKPEYPRSSLRHGEQGIVNASFLIGFDGAVVDKKVVKSSGFANLDHAVLDALGKCNFQRAKADQATEPSWHGVQYVWTMK